MISAEFTAWQNLRQHNTWPRAGGWQDQSLSMLVHMTAFDLVVGTKNYLASADAKWDELSVTQADLIRWLEAE